MKFLKKILSSLVTISLVLSMILSGNVIATNSGTQIIDTKVENTKNPIGIDVTKPRFSWKMDSIVTGQLQTKYQVIVSTTVDKLATDNGDVWDSGVITSDVSNGVEYAGTALQSRQKYYWKVYVYDKDGNKLVSENSYFEMGLLNKSLWSGQFISSNKLTAANVPAYSIEVDFKIDSANAGIVFGDKNGQFLMWQINSSDFAGQQKVYFRPHRWNPGAAVIVEKDISSAIPWSTRNDTHTMKIVVDANNLITTYIDGTQIDQRTETLAAFGQIVHNVMNAYDGQEMHRFLLEQQPIMLETTIVSAYSLQNSAFMMFLKHQLIRQRRNQ